jgi:hypothetical protein
MLNKFLSQYEKAISTKDTECRISVIDNIDSNPIENKDKFPLTTSTRYHSKEASRDLCETISNEKKKNMNLRFNTYELNKKLEESNKKREELENVVERLYKEKNADSKYLIKLENNLILCKNELNELKMRKDINVEVKNILEENKKLKEFRNEIFKISLKYEQINDDMRNFVMNIYDVFNKSTGTVGDICFFKI